MGRMYKNISKTMRKAWKDYVYSYRLAYFLGGFVLFLILFGELYYVFLVTCRASINFWYALFKGQPLSFYSRVAEIGGGTPNREALSGAAYDFTIYFSLPFGIFQHGYMKESLVIRQNQICFV